jgi:hypothetical protein
VTVELTACEENTISLPSNQNALDFIERNLIIPPVVEAGRAGAFVVRHSACQRTRVVRRY